MALFTKCPKERVTTNFNLKINITILTNNLAYTWYNIKPVILEPEDDLVNQLDSLQISEAAEDEPIYDKVPSSLVDKVNFGLYWNKILSTHFLLHEIQWK